ncbi:protein disulfide-isomerase 2 [Bicyclus anynana]|uniref:Protein disulfide-isomerase 2 n=1 Tax=Bicyclus anynana TaxID=110368 RepID=A0ABM3LF45_BICAN|nr:protein disulfide-isomerase 2 [Bicyclus anynana]
MDNIESTGESTGNSVVEITQSNIDSIIASNELVFINFYTGWCSFSRLLMPIYHDAADEVMKAGYDTGKVVVGKVDCDKEHEIASRFNITKYPTLQLFRNGSPTKKEYRGQRSVEAITEFIKYQLIDPVIQFSNLKELQNLSEDKRHIIGYMDRKDQPEYDVFRKAAASLKDESCLFHVGFGEVSHQIHPSGQPIVVFRNDKTSVEPDETYHGSLLNYDELHAWMEPKCIPLVREITLENAEKLTEEGLPFLILFHHPSDTESVKKYKEIVSSELESEKQNINFLTGDGVKFEHPMNHLKKSVSDLPLIAIDSYRHMFLFPEYKDIEKPGKLKQFLQDFYSGKLSRDLHHKPEEINVMPKRNTKNIQSTIEAIRNGVVEITGSNIDYVLANYELVLIVYYCEGDPASARLLHTFDNVAREIKEARFSYGKLALGKVDCVKEDAIRNRFQQYDTSYLYSYELYPTVKLFTNGLLSKHGCRCKQTVQGFVDFIKEQLRDPIIVIKSLDELHDLSENKGHIVAYLICKDQYEYKILRNVATSLREECQFYVMFGYSEQRTNLTGKLRVVFRSTGGCTVELRDKYDGSMCNFSEVYTWVNQRIFPLLREITSDIEDELRMKDNYPFIILLHLPSDTESVKQYKEVIRKEFTPEKRFTVLLADGRKFEHLLVRFGKTITDLPLIAVDNYKNIRIFDYNTMMEPGKLERILNDIERGQIDQCHVTVYSRLTPMDYTNDVYSVFELFE